MRSKKKLSFIALVAMSFISMFCIACKKQEEGAAVDTLTKMVNVTVEGWEVQVYLFKPYS